MSADPLSPWGAIGRALSFRLGAEGVGRLGTKHLVAGLACTWLVGIGRWWDDPRAGLLQHLGLGSVIYVFVLAALLWLVLWPLAPGVVSYRAVLTFVSLTSPPAILYAIPVERFFSLATAGRINLWFLAVVATWRVALLLRFLASVPAVGIVKGVIAAILPLTAIVTALTLLNLHRVVFSIMGGIADADRTAHDAAYGVLVMLTLLSTTLLPVLLVAYVAGIVHSWLRRKAARQGQ
ncbi:MAG: hypothetical protein IT377_14835 [Polyangiaceae bacterium]|nr:hypothetical protein [Polyangiaceae bacterium]